MTRRRRTPTYTAVNLWILVCAAALGGAAAITIVLRRAPVLELAGALIVGCVALLFTLRTAVTVERHGVRARLGLFGFPRRFIATDAIVRAIVVNVRPVKDYRGWGDRLGHGTRAFVSRRGEALRLELTRGPAFVVTIDDARRAADRVNAFVDELRPARPAPPRARRRRPHTPAVRPWF